MPTPKDYDDDVKSAPSGKIVFLIFATVADTSARLFLPTIGGTILGIWLDHTFDLTPICTILGVLLGSAMAFMLVYFQIQKVKK